MLERNSPHPPAPRRRELLLRFTAILVGVIGAAVVAEVGLRLGGYERSYVNPLGSFHVSDPVFGYRGKPNFTGRFRAPEFDVLVAHDDAGFRRQEHQHPLAQSRHQVLVFGDSFTWGWGVGQGEGFTDQLSLLLPQYHVRNFGLCGSGTVQHLAIFDALGKDTLRPGDTVVLAFFGNDFNDNLSGVVHAEVRDGTVRWVGPTKQIGGGIKAMLKDGSYFINLIIYSTDRITAARHQRRAQRWAGEFASQGERSPEIIVAKQLLADFQRACTERQARFVIAYIPGQGELREATDGDENRPKIEAGYRRALFAIANTHGIPVIDLLPHFLAAARSGRSGRLTIGRDEHWTAPAHAIVAQAIAQFIGEVDGQAAVGPG